MRISIFGAGYVGLVSGACLAERGHDVTCVDLDRHRVEQINAGASPIVEPGLDPLLRNHARTRLRATTDGLAAVLHTDLTLIAVGTPFDGTAIDLSHVEACARAIGRALAQKSDYHTVVVKSTVVPGTTENVVVPILESASGKRAGADFGVGMNPEFLTEGEAVSDFMAPDRIVVGGIDQRSQDAMAELYSSFAGVPLFRTNPSTAEMIKYASNALLATMISFSNELANLAAAIGDVDIVDVMHGVHASRYLTPTSASGTHAAPVGLASFLMAGCGFGGSCLPKDVSALVADGRSRGLPMDVLAAVLKVNARQPSEIFRLLSKHFDSLAGRKISVLGLSFRPDTDDMRESPAIPVVRRLLDEGATVVAYDPVAGEQAKHEFGDAVHICSSLQEALDGVDAVIVVTRWDHFGSIADLLPRGQCAPLVVDGRRMLDKARFDRYEGIGA
jgi:UDPglucose 6-dehydrogenase/GDP-mannose 6-dehydrogenase